MIRKWSWMLVGVLLWGVPLGLTIPFLSAFLKPGHWSEIQEFQQDIFLHNLFIFFPIFIGLGMVYGLWMYRLSQKYQKQP